MYQQELTTSLGYLRRLSVYKIEKPYFVNFPVPVGENAPPQHNVLHEWIDNIPIYDVRGQESQYNIDRHGFQVVKHTTSMNRDDFSHDAVIRDKYYPEMIKLVKQTLGAARVVPFEHTHRLSQHNGQGCQGDRKRKPLRAAHVDQTPASSAQRLRYHMGDEAAELLRHRFQIVNIWRPLQGPLRDYPLTLGDARTFDFDRDGEPTDLVFPHYVGESMNLYPHKDHKWYFLSDQTPEEPWIFKCFDSKSDVAMAAPHCSFDIQNGGDAERRRESIEIRMIVMYD